MNLERMRLTERVALCIVDPDMLEFLEDRLVFHPFSDRLEPHDVTDAIDCFDHRLIDNIGRQSSDEAAVDLQIVDRQALEIAERRQSGAEVVQRETATESFQGVDE